MLPVLLEGKMCGLIDADVFAETDNLRVGMPAAIEKLLTFGHKNRTSGQSCNGWRRSRHKWYNMETFREYYQHSRRCSW